MCQKRMPTSCTRIMKEGAASASRYRASPSSALTQLAGGIYAYYHLSSSFTGDQADYARVPYANTNLLKVPSSVPN